ncbi:hypothetical protein WG66_001053 [Moniliophthora roreri]|nr:hypothetical protein WG66_001053 [Moniliophthora roreri]
MFILVLNLHHLISTSKIPDTDISGYDLTGATVNTRIGKKVKSLDSKTVGLEEQLGRIAHLCHFSRHVMLSPAADNDAILLHVQECHQFETVTISRKPHDVSFLHPVPIPRYELAATGATAVLQATISSRTLLADAGLAMSTSWSAGPLPRHLVLCFMSGLSTYINAWRPMSFLPQYGCGSKSPRYVLYINKSVFRRII